MFYGCHGCRIAVRVDHWNLLSVIGWKILNVIEDGRHFTASFCADCLERLGIK